VIKKKIVFKIPEGAEKEKLLEEIMNSVSSQEAIYKIKGNTLELRIIGDPLSVERSIEVVRRILSKLLQELDRGGSITIVNISEAAKTLGVPVPIDSFMELLQLMNIKVKRTENELLIYEAIDKVQEIARDFFSTLKASRAVAAGKAAELIAVLSLFHDILPSEISNAGKELGLFEEKDGKLYLTKNWNDALKIFNNRDLFSSAP